VLPVDAVVAEKFDPKAKKSVVDVSKIPKDWMALDIGPRTVQNIIYQIKKSKTIIWFGPIGVFEWKRFSDGTREVANSLASSSATVIVGGGDSASAVDQPDSADSWDTNTSKLIEWDKWGDFATVNIYYRPDDQTAWDLLNTGGPVESCQDEIDGLGDKLNGSWSWYIDEDTVLSPTAQIMVRDAVNATARLEGVSEEFTTKGIALGYQNKFVEIESKHN